MPLYNSETSQSRNFPFEGTYRSSVCRNYSKLGSLLKTTTATVLIVYKFGPRGHQSVGDVGWRRGWQTNFAIWRPLFFVMYFIVKTVSMVSDGH